MSEQPTEAEARKLLDWLIDLDPAWRERVIALQEERGADPLRTLGILIGNTLESGNHMAIPDLPHLLDDYIPAGQTRPCPQCGQPYTLAYPGQPYCGNECAAIARGEVRRVQAEVVVEAADEAEALTALPSTATSFKNRKTR